MSVDVQAPLGQPLRYPTLYFDDGDLVIHAGRDGETPALLFKVHTAILGHFSPVFRDMLSLPAGAQSRETHDGVPLVRVQDDAVAMTQLVNALYNPGEPVFERTDPDFAQDVYELMNVARKYQVDSLCNRIVRHIEQQWPRMPDAYVQQHGAIRNADKARSTLQEDAHGWPQLPCIFLQFPEPASAIRLATAFDIPGVLPAAYYALSTTHPGHTWAGARPGQAVRPAKWDLLDDGALLRHFHGKYALALRWGETEAKLLAFFDSREDNPCPKRPQASRVRDARWTCYTALLDIVHGRLRVKANTARDAMLDDVLTADPLMEMYELAEDTRTWLDLCTTCREATRRYLVRQMRELWEELPKIFKVQ